MDKDVLISTLNRIEDKLDKVSTGLTSNTTTTESHTKILGDMKENQTVNSKVIQDTRDEIKDINNSMAKIDSWKNGQTLYQHKTLEDIQNLFTRLSPIEKDFFTRTQTKIETVTRIKGIVWDGIKVVTFIVVGAIIVSWKDIAQHIF